MTQLKQWISSHTAWFALGLGMVIILIFEAREIGLQASQWFWLIVITFLVAGACIWIVSWGDDENEESS